MYTEATFHFSNVFEESDDLEEKKTVKIQV